MRFDILSHQDTVIFALLTAAVLCVAVYAGYKTIVFSKKLIRSAQGNLRPLVSLRPLVLFTSCVTSFLLLYYLIMPAKTLAKEETDRKKGPLVIIFLDTNWYMRGDDIRRKLFHSHIRRITELFNKPAAFKILFFEGKHTKSYFTDTANFYVPDSHFGSNVMQSYFAHLKNRPRFHLARDIFDYATYDSLVRIVQNGAYQYLDTLEVINEVNRFNTGTEVEKINVDLFIVFMTFTPEGFDTYLTGPAFRNNYQTCDFTSRQQYRNNQNKFNSVFVSHLVLDNSGNFTHRTQSAFITLLDKIERTENKIDFVRYDILFGLEMNEVRLWIKIICAAIITAFMSTIFCGAVKIKKII